MAQADPSLSPNLNAPPLPPRYPAIAKALAHHLARRAIERQLRAQGLCITRYAEVIEQARAYLVEHPELLDEAAEIVRTRPQYRAMAERDERERQRQWRKAQRKLGVMDIQRAQP